MKRLLASLAMLSVLSLSVPLGAIADAPAAAPSPVVPAAATGPVAASLIITDAFGMHSAALDEKWQAKLSAALSTGGVPTTCGAAVLSGPAATGLQETQKQALSAAPDLLTSSSYASQMIPTRWLLLVNMGEGDNPAIHPVLIDLEKHETHGLPDDFGKTSDEAIGQLTTSVHGFLTQSGQAAMQPVKGNVLSKLYHKADADHIQAEDCVTFQSEADAKSNGYQPCTICFPHTTGIVKPDATEVALGHEVSASVEQQYRLCRNAKVKERVDRIGARLVEASDVRDFPYTFTVLESEDINAFSAGAGNVFITTGIINVLESDDEIATVLGHEMAHCENHHIIRTYRSAQTVNILGVLVGAATGSLGHIMTNFMSMIFGRGYSRNFELQADHGGLIYTYAAGYDPHAFIITLKKLKDFAALQKGKTPAWLRTHPTEDKRIEAINAELDMLGNYDKHVQETRPKDPGLADEMRKHAFFYLDHGEVMQAFVSAYGNLHLAFNPALQTSSVPAPTTNKTSDGDLRD